MWFCTSIAIAAARRLLAELTQPLPLATRDVLVHASVGVAASITSAAESSEELPLPARAGEWPLASAGPR